MYKKVAITLAALVLVGFVGTVAAVKLLVTEQKILAVVVPQVEKVLGRKVAIANAKSMVFPYLGVELTGLNVSNTTREEFRTDESFLAFETFLIKVEFLPLLKKQVVIDQIVIRKADLLVESGREGSFNFDDLTFMTAAKDTTQPKKPMETFPVKIKKILIEDSRVRYYDNKTGLSLVMNAINDRTDFDMDKSMKKLTTTGELSIAGMEIVTDKKSQPLTDLKLTFNHDIAADLGAETVTIKAITAKFQKIGIALSGDIAAINSDPKLNLKLTSEPIGVQDIINEIPSSMSPEIAKIKAAGTLNLGMTIGGTAKKPAINGNLKLDGGKIHYTDLPQSINDIAMAMQFTENSLNIEKLAMKLGANPIDIVLKVNDFANPFIDGKVDAKLNLDDMRQMMKLPDGFTVGGRIDASIAAKGNVDPARPEALDMKGTVAVTGLKAKTIDLKEPINVDGSMKFSPVEIAQDVMIKIADSDFGFKGSLKNYLAFVFPKRYTEKASLTMAYNSKLMNLNSFIVKKTPAAPAQPTAKKAPAQVLTQPLPAITVNVSGTCGTFKYDQITLTNVKSSIALNGQTFAVNGTAGLYGGTTKGGFTLNADNLRDIKTDIIFDVNAIQANNLISTFNDQLKENRALTKELKKLDAMISGSATFQSKFSSHGRTDEDLTKNLTGTIYANLADGTIKAGSITNAIGGPLKKFISFNDIQFQKVRFNAKIADEKLYIDTMDLKSPRVGDWYVSGPIGFDASLGLTVETRLTKEVSAPAVAMQTKGKGAASSVANKYLAGTPVAGIAQNQINRGGIPVDADGRITLILGMAGTAAAPKVEFKGFKEGVAGTAADQGSLKGDLKAELNKQIDGAKAKADSLANAAKAQAQAKADEAKKKVEAEAKAAQEKLQAEADAAKKKADEAAKSAADKAKNAVKNFKF